MYSTNYCPRKTDIDKTRNHSYTMTSILKSVADVKHQSYTRYGITLVDTIIIPEQLQRLTYYVG
uniref:Uncharacterized protein n=1 Tax=Lepeophtheirus salmonis TaxID=72036 RepID=A0A0K2UWR1_LEPSM